MDAGQHFGAFTGARGYEIGGDKPGAGHAKAHRQLLKCAGKGAGVAGLGRGHIGIGQRVHRGKLRRHQYAIDHRLAANHPDGRGRADRAEQHQHAAQSHRIADEQRAVAEKRQFIAHEGFAGHRAQRLRHDQQPRLQRRETQPRLIEQRQQERRAAHPQPCDEAAGHSGGKGAEFEQAKVKQRMCQPPCMEPVERQQRQRHRPRARQQGAACVMFAKHLQRPRQQRNAAAEIDQPQHIKLGHMLGAVIGQVQIDHDQSDDADRHVHEKDHVPCRDRNDEAAQRRTNQRANQRRDRHKTHRAQQLGLGEGAHQRQPPNRHHHRPAHALQQPKHHQRRHAARKAAQDRANGENRDCAGKHPPRAEAIGHPPTRRNEYRKAERIARQHRFHRQFALVERARHGRDGSVEHGGVERFHQERHRNQPRQQPQRRGFGG